MKTREVLTAHVQAVTQKRFEQAQKLYRAKIPPTVEDVEKAEKQADYLAARYACLNRVERRKLGERGYSFGFGRMEARLKKNT